MSFDMKTIFRRLLAITDLAAAGATQSGTNPEGGTLFTNEYIYIGDVACLTLTAYLSQTATITVDQSADGGDNVYYTNDYAFATGTSGTAYSIEAVCPFVRLKLANGAATQTVARVALCGRKVS